MIEEMTDYDINIWDDVSYIVDGLSVGSYRVDVYPNKDGEMLDMLLTSFRLSEEDVVLLSEILDRDDVWLSKSEAPDWLKERIENN